MLGSWLHNHTDVELEGVNQRNLLLLSRALTFCVVEDGPVYQAGEAGI